MINLISWWAFTGTIKLIFFTWQDFKNNMRVDDRYNSFMMGMSIAFIPYIGRTILYVLPLLIIIPLFYYFLKKVKVLGQGDIHTMTWILTGYGLINMFYAAWFCVIFMFVTGIYFIMKLWLMPFIFEKLKIGEKKFWKKPMPFYPVILVAFVVTNLLLKVY